VVINPGIGIDLQCPDPNGFISSNLFDNLRIWGARTGIRFRVFDGYARGQETAGIFYNTLSNVRLEWTRDDARAGVYNVAIEDVVGVHNTFLEVMPWDAPGDTLMTSAEKADGTLIVGGILGGERRNHPNNIVDRSNPSTTNIVN